MASTNFKIFDENGTNMLSDGDYAADTQRTGGVQGGIASSQLQNKFQHQISYMTKAIADMLVNKGIDINDTENYANFAAKVAQGLDNITYGTTEPTSATPCSKVGQFYLWDKGNMFFALYMCISLNPTTWFLVKDIAPVVKTETFTQDGTFTMPATLNQSVTVTAVGAGGDGNHNSTVYGGGSGAVLKKWTGTIPRGTSVSVTIGQVVSNSNGQASSFGSYVTASGGVAPTSAAGASAILDGGMGGGGGNSNAPGGNGGTYGGGGGGGTSTSNSHGGSPGGNGGTYGGGGGGGYGYTGGWSGGTGGNGGTYGSGGGGGTGSGGASGNGGTGGVNPGNSGSAGGSGGVGISTVGLGLEFEGYGLAGVGSQGPGSGGGGGGYGGNGGNGSVNVSSGGGGGGYGGNGAAGSSSGGGGGGYGGNGGSELGVAYNSGGGGYGPDNFGAGGYYTSSAKPGIVIVQYQVLE